MEGRVFLVLSLGLWLTSAESDAPLFRLETASGASSTGPLLALDKNWTVRMGGSAEVRADDVLAVRRVGSLLPAVPAKGLVMFANGDRVPAQSIKLAGERLTFVALAGEKLEFRVPLSAVLVIWLTTPDGEKHPDKLRRDLATSQRSRGQVLLRNGDVLEGTLASMDEKALGLEIEKKEIEVKVDRVAAIALSTELTAARLPKRPYGRLVLANGCRLSLHSATCDGKLLLGTTLFGAEAKIPLDQIVALYVYQSRAVYLSDLKPSKIEQVPYLDVAAPPVRDGSVKGRDLRLGGSTYDKGLGMHSACRMTYDLGGAYKRFEALVGLDDVTGRDGSVSVEVLVDGKPQKLGLEKDLAHRNGPLTVCIDVSGAKQLTLAVTFGERGDVQDDVDWVNARLIK
jgi:hypothetical protein